MIEALLIKKVTKISLKITKFQEFDYYDTRKFLKISKKFYFFNFQLFIQKNSKCFEIINEDNIIKKFLKIQFSFSKSSIVSYDIKERYKPS